MSVDAIIKFFSKTLYVRAVSLPRHNSSAQLPNELPGKLLSGPLVWVRRGGVIPPLQPLYNGPYAVLCRGPRSFTIWVGSWDKVIAVNCLKACTAADATLAACVAAADRWVRTQAVLMQPSGSRFQTRWFLHLLLWRRHKMVPEPFSYPVRRFLHARDRRRHHRCHRRSTRPVNEHCNRG